MTKSGDREDSASYVQADFVWSEKKLESRLTPLLKWPGGKRDLVKSLAPFLPHRFRQYFEPFLGGGALYFALRPQSAVLADNNHELINCYEQVRDNPDAVIRHLHSMSTSKEDYYSVRASEPTDPVERAARLNYLTTPSFNGIFRVNLNGEFNVPYGYKMHVQVYEEAKIRTISEALKGAVLLCGDFESSVDTAGPGDLVYLDPPYTVAHGQNGFVKYNAAIFSWADQKHLAQTARQLTVRGCHVVVSNADHPSVRDLYPEFQCATIHRASRMSGLAKYRRRVTESVLYGGG